ncbi:hypothetical protein ACFQAT_06140 [Undibacterium arcticum]|uniref:hypothetical protein n=1 Tax=Undibacterium arcticum TaxID=1762892 RepID=UPI003611C3C7
MHAVMMCANNREQAVGFFRATLGLYYLSKIMVEQELDFKKIDQEFNVFIYRTLGKGHSITSILQYMSSKKVLWVLDAKSFIPTFLNYFPDIPFRNIPLLLSINLSVSKKSPASRPPDRCRTGPWNKPGASRRPKAAQRSNRMRHRIEPPTTHRRRPDWLFVNRCHHHHAHKSRLQKSTDAYLPLARL